MTPTLWYDFTNTPHVQFLRPFVQTFGAEYGRVLSCRNFSETVSLARLFFGEEPIVVGGHGGRHKAGKVLKLGGRFLSLALKIPHFDAVLACGGTEAAALARLRGKTAILFDDNDVSPNWMYAPFATHAFFPRAVPTERLRAQGFGPKKLYQYDGYKEDVYVADFQPDDSFPRILPFRDYWVVRPENLLANYVGGAGGSIVPELLLRLEKAGFNILFLPRYPSDRKLASGHDNVFVPDRPVDGLNAIYWSLGVMTGAGTLAREAASMGKPAISFYAGTPLLAVDRMLISEGRLLHSRNPERIIETVLSASAREADFRRARAVRDEVFHEVRKRLPQLSVDRPG